MTINLKDNINTESYVLKHAILLEATNLIVGREGVLQTEKDLYLILAFMDVLSKEDLITICNEDQRDLGDILREDIEPQFFELIKQDEYKILYNEMKTLFTQRCQEIWNEQHSILGIIDAILTTIASMTDEDKKEALIATGKIAEQAFDRRTEIMKEKTEAVNSKLEDFIRKYQETVNKQQEIKQSEDTIE